MYSPTLELASFDGGDRLRGFQALLDALWSVNCDYLRRPVQVPRLYASGVVWACSYSERPRWRDIPAVLEVGSGCCYDLAAYRAAELSEREGVPARPRVVFVGVSHRAGTSAGEVLDYHAVVSLPGGAVEDPSEVLTP